MLRREACGCRGRIDTASSGSVANTFTLTISMFGFASVRIRQEAPFLVLGLHGQPKQMSLMKIVASITHRKNHVSGLMEMKDRPEVTKAKTFMLQKAQR